MLKATWIDGRPQWNRLSIGRTKSVQPYCRLAIITMQMMPATSWTRRVDAGWAAAEAELDDIPNPPWIVLRFWSRNSSISPANLRAGIR